MADVEHLIAEEWTVILRVPCRTRLPAVEELCREVGRALSTLCVALSRAEGQVEVCPRAPDPP